MATPSIPQGSPPGRGDHPPVLRDRRRLRPSQPTRKALRLPQAAFGLRDPHPHALPAAPRGRIRTLLLARSRPLLLPPLPGGRGLLPVLVAPQGAAQAEAILGALEAGDPARADGGPRDLARGFDPALGAASEAGRTVGGLRGRRLGEAGFLLGLRGEAAHAVRRQPGAYLLRADSRQRGGGRTERRTLGRVEPPGRRGGARPQGIQGPRLPERTIGEGLGRVRDLAGYRVGPVARRGQAAE